MKDTIDLISRIFIAIMFYYEAFDSFLLFSKTKKTMSAYGINWNQDFILGTIIVFLILGATLILIGYHSNFGAILLLLYIVPYTLIFYSFWDVPVDTQRIQLINFMKNLAVIGGLLLLTINKPGKYSIKKLIYVMRLPG